MHPRVALTLLTATVAFLSPAHLFFLPSSKGSHIVTSTTRQCDEFISVFNITNSSSASLIHAHVRLWLNSSAQTVNVEVSRLVSAMSNYSLDVDGWNQSYEVPAYRSDRTFNALYTMPMPSNGSATVELQLSYASMQNLSVVAVPFNNWTVALDFKYKCRMASGNYGDNQLYSCLCCNSPGDHQDTDTCPVVTMYQEGDDTTPSNSSSTSGDGSSEPGDSSGSTSSSSSSTTSSTGGGGGDGTGSSSSSQGSGEATNSTTSGGSQGQGSGSGQTTNSTTSGSSEGQGSGQASNSTTSGSGEAANSTASGESQGQGSGSGQATNSTTTSGSSEGQGSGQATNSTTSGEGQGQGSGSGGATNSTSSGSSEGQGSGQATNSTTSGSSEATNSTTSGESQGQGSGSGGTTNSTTSGEGQDSGKGSGSGVADTTNTTTPLGGGDVLVPPEPKMSTLEWILVGILGALVVLLLLIGVLALVVRKSGINFFLS